MNVADRSKGTLALLFGCAALALVVPACGDDDDDTTGTGGKGGAGGAGGKSATTGGTPTTTGGTGAGGKSVTTGGATSGGKGGTGGTTTGGTATGGAGGEPDGGIGGVPETTGGTATGGATTGGATTGGTGGTNGGTSTGGTSTGGTSTGGTSAGAGGVPEGGSDAGGQGGETVGGAGGEGGGSNPPLPVVCTTGCAVLSAPLAAGVEPDNVKTGFVIPFNAVDLTGVSLTIRLCVLAGDASGNLQYYTQDPSFNGNYNAYFRNINQLQDCSLGMQEVVIPIAVEGTFNPATSTNIVLQLGRNGAGPWSTTTVLVDSVTTTGDAVGPYNFTSNAAAFKIGGNPIPGSTLTWLKQ